MFFHTLNPRNYWQAWLTDDAARSTLRLDRCARIERRERDRIALRAERFWDDDRRAEAEDQGARLAEDPSRTVERLRRTPQGCDWLIRRWAWLAHEADRAQSWSDTHKALAFDLLGTPRDLRTADPGLVLDGDGRAASETTDPASVARREIAALRARRLDVADADALDRNLAMADMSEQATPELRRLRRHENTLHKRLRWTLHQLQVEPRHFRPNPDLQHLYEPEPEPEAEPEPEPTPVPPTTAAPPEPEAEPAPAPVAIQGPAPARRPEPALLKAQARRQAKRRRADRLDN
jgi:hypothetical protein